METSWRAIRSRGRCRWGRGNFCRVQLSGRRFAVPVFARARKSTSLSSSLPSFVDPRRVKGSTQIFRYFLPLSLFSLFHSRARYTQRSVILRLQILLFSLEQVKRACTREHETKFPRHDARQAIFAYTLRTYFKRYSLLFHKTILEQTSVSPHFFSPPLFSIELGPRARESKGKILFLCFSPRTWKVDESGSSSIAF